MELSMNNLELLIINITRLCNILRNMEFKDGGIIHFFLNLPCAEQEVLKINNVPTLLALFNNK